MRCLRNLSRRDEETMKRLFSVREGAQGRPKAQRPTGWSIGRCLSCIPTLPFSSRADLPQGDRPQRRVSPTSRSGRRWERWHGGSGTTSTAGFFADSAQAADVSATLSLITRAWARAQRNRDTDSRRACDPRRRRLRKDRTRPRKIEENEFQKAQVFSRKVSRDFLKCVKSVIIE